MTFDSMVVFKTGFCPAAKVDVALFANYEKDADGRLAFSVAHCELIDNLKKPREDRDPRIPEVACEDSSKCPLYSRFAPFVNP